LRTHAVLIVGAAVLVFSLGALAAGGVLAHARRASNEEIFTAPGTYTWTAPETGTVTFDVFGAEGNDGDSNGPGRGGEARGSFHVTAGKTFEIVVGGHPDGHPGGFNGGGGASVGGGGGGASDVRAAECATSKSCGLQDRIIVGGGGGGDSGGFPGRSAGGNGGGTRGEQGVTDGGGGGTQISGGTGANGEGSFGTGGPAAGGGRPECQLEGGGGGGGWFGGGGGGRHCNKEEGGGGGSGYISPLALNGAFPGGKESGHGKVIVTIAHQAGLGSHPVPTGGRG
jgi:hypothetical protein